MRRISNSTVFVLTMGVLLTIMLAMGCHEQKKVVRTVYSVPEGSSIKTAVTIYDRYTAAGIRSEHKWTAEKYPDYSWDNQVLQQKNGRYYDVITLQRGKDVKTVYFDITSFYGRQ